MGVNVLNASTVSGIAHTTATALTAQGFDVTEVGNAATELPASGASEILYGPSGLEAAHTLASVLGGPVTLVPDASLSGQPVSLLIASSQLTVTGSSGQTTTTTTPTGPTTTTTIPADVYTNTQPEPWNPFPCTIGQPTSATPTTAHRAAKNEVAAQADLRRCRTIRRRSRSVVPPQMPSRSRWARACSRHA